VGGGPCSRDAEVGPAHLKRSSESGTGARWEWPHRVAARMTRPARTWSCAAEGRAWFSGVVYRCSGRPSVIGVARFMLRNTLRSLRRRQIAQTGDAAKKKKAGWK